MQLNFIHIQFIFLIVVYGEFSNTYWIPSLIAILTLSIFSQGHRYEKFILFIGSFLQLTYLLSQIGGDLWKWNWPFLTSALIAASVQLFFFCCLIILRTSKSLLRSNIIQPWLLAFVFLFLICYLNGLENLYIPKLGWAVSYFLWPFLLSVHDLKIESNRKIDKASLFLSLCPPWFARLFHNVPTEHGPQDFNNHFSANEQTRAEYRKSAMKQMWFVMLVITINLVINWLLKGRALLHHPDLPSVSFWNYTPPWHLRNFIEIDYHKDLAEFVMAGFFQVVTMFFQFIILSNTANAIALFMGFKFTQNERVAYGLKMARSWSLLMHYLNHLAKTIFFNPAVRYLSFIKNRRHKNMLAAIFAIYSFGICYLAFLPFGGIFRNGAFTTRFTNRLLYLSLICAIAGFRIYGPKVKPHTWHGQILQYTIPFFLILVMSMGILSLSS